MGGKPRRRRKEAPTSAGGSFRRPHGAFRASQPTPGPTCIRPVGRFEPKSRRRPPSPTPPPSPSTAPQSCDLQSCACRRADREVADWLGASRSESMLLLLLRGYLALRRSLLLRGGLRLCLLHHAALLAKSRWRCRISTRGNRRRCNSITTARRKKQLPH